MVMETNPQLFQRVIAFLGKDVKNWTLIKTIDELLKSAEQQQNESISLSESISEADAIIEQYKLQETILLERLKKQTLEIKDLKSKSRTIRFFEMAEENLKLAEENARLKELVKA